MSKEKFQPYIIQYPSLSSDERTETFDQRFDSLILPYKEISGEDLLAVKEVWEKSKIQNYRLINLSGNPLGNEGAKIVAQMIDRAYWLESLWLNDCQIGDEGIIAIAEAVYGNSNLRDLQFRHNSIGDKGAMELLVSFKSTTPDHDYPRAVDLSVNNITDALDQFLSVMSKYGGVNLSVAVETREEEEARQQKEKRQREEREKEREIDRKKKIEKERNLQKPSDKLSAVKAEKLDPSLEKGPVSRL